MRFKHMNYFIAVAEELHFGRAAERLNMAQPPLSRQIRLFEDELGAVLFDRGRSATRLTPAGKRLLERSRAILRQIEDARNEVRRLGQGAQGRLRIGFVGSATFGILPEIVKTFRAQFPDVDLNLQPMNNAQLHQGLVSRELDAAFSRPALEDTELTARNLVEEDLIVAVPESLGVGQDGFLDLGRLPPTAHVLYPEFPRPSYADLVLQACAAHGIDTSRQVWTMDTHTALSLVAIGEGICIVPESVGSQPRAGVRFCKVRPLLGTTTLALNFRLDERGAHVQNLLQIAQRIARQKPPSVFAA
ncbi:LysR family transcriptional regulator [Thioclava sp. SK-1]|uniref:LysR substrate-binding domain-containing protein n=1 Tax=Thioclava sp. SK-1 TaxID=1889770 RepID=UPI000826F38E|nr:LysR substrate-binding domain-containing protein [Thioclava sp. SK-1]OCX65619.1 LysR family transcriptional regulator [Thioclava sp. SK-1]